MKVAGWSEIVGEMGCRDGKCHLCQGDGEVTRTNIGAWSYIDICHKCKEDGWRVEHSDVTGWVIINGGEGMMIDEMELENYKAAKIRDIQRMIEDASQQIKDCQLVCDAAMEAMHQLIHFHGGDGLPAIECEIMEKKLAKASILAKQAWIEMMFAREWGMP